MYLGWCLTHSLPLSASQVLKIQVLTSTNFQDQIQPPMIIDLPKCSLACKGGRRIYCIKKHQNYFQSTENTQIGFRSLSKLTQQINE